MNTRVAWDLLNLQTSEQERLRDYTIERFGGCVEVTLKISQSLNLLISIFISYLCPHFILEGGDVLAHDGFGAAGIAVFNGAHDLAMLLQGSIQ
jgi:hypothetical protein